MKRILSHSSTLLALMSIVGIVTGCSSLNNRVEKQISSISTESSTGKPGPSARRPVTSQPIQRQSSFSNSQRDGTKSSERQANVTIPNRSARTEASRQALDGNQSLSSTKTAPSAQSSEITKPTSPVEACDKLAAHPDDPEAFTEGVTDLELNSQGVIQACELAIKDDRNSPRLAFQLARGYLKAHRSEDAIDQLLSAAKLGHGGSLAYLGDIHLDGGPGIEPDPNIAKALYEHAAAAGFDPARKVLAQFEDYTDKFSETEEVERNIALSANMHERGPVTPVKVKFITPDIILNIEKGDYAAIKLDEPFVKRYLHEVANTINEECPSAFTRDEMSYIGYEAERVNKLEPRLLSVNPFLLAAKGEEIERIRSLLDHVPGDKKGNSKETIERIGKRHTVEMDAMKDGFSVIMKNWCETEGIAKFNKNLLLYMQNKWSPEIRFISTQDDLCLEGAKRNGMQDAGERSCQCLVNVNSLKRKSQKIRKDLYENYWEVTQQFAREDPEAYAGCK